MNDELIRTALRDATDTRDVVVGQGALGAVPEVFRRNFGEDATVMLVVDANTWRVAGERVQQELETAGAPVSTSTSASTARGAGHSIVDLNPSASVIAAPKAV